MKVLLLEDVSQLGKAGDVVEVADGYGRNFLLPRGLALFATPSVLSEVEMHRQAYASRQAQTDAQWVEVAGILDGKEINIKAQAGAKERLYGSITKADIAREIHHLTGIDIDKRRIEMGQPIHRLGSHEVTIKLGKDAVPKIKVIVEGEGD